jgi:ADP-ribose pyrophosphatase YjhB (NUDIX family)
VLARLHRGLLHVFQRLPVGARRRVVRTIAPSYTVGAMCFIEREDGAVLLVRLSYRERWGVPGGLLKRGEAVSDAARREVAEEVGLEVELLGEPAVVVDAPAQRVDVIYRARVAPGCDWRDARPMSPEIVELAWFNPTTLPELQFEASGAFVAMARSSLGTIALDQLSFRGMTRGDDDEPSTGAAAS